jgi:predicted O-methyltransferase YrrM
MKLSNAIFEMMHALRHRWQAKIRHGVHSPFVFAMQDGVLKNAAMLPMATIEKCRTKLLHDQRTFERVDLGAGSRKSNSNRSSVAQFAQRSLQKEHPARILRGLADAVNAQNVLELGTALGITTAYLACDRPNRNVATLEGDPFVLQIAQETWQELELKNITGHCGAFDQLLSTEQLKEHLWDMVLVDGNHTYEATIRYWNTLKDKITPQGCLIFDDIYWSPGMYRAWCEISADPKVGITLDYFDFGVVFLFPRRQKEHYKLRMPTMAPRTKFV